MQTGWRLYAVMIALAALTGTVVALALSGGPRFGEPARSTSFAPSPSAPSRAAGSPSASPTATADASATPSATPSPSPSASAAEDPLARIRPLVFAWRPAGTTLIVEDRVGDSSRIVAVPLDGSSATPLVEVPAGAAWAMRRDGSAIAVALDTGSVTTPRLRIAALNLATGARGWVTPEEPTRSQRSPVWSLDGTVIYYAKAEFDGADAGVFRIRADGTNLTQLRAPTAALADPVGLTADGLTLLLETAQDPALVALDLAARTTRTLEGARLAALRPDRPRVLATVEGGGTGTVPRLVLWDDLGGAAPATLVAQPIVAGADWDPAGARIVAATTATLGGEAPQLVVMDATGASRTPVEGTEGAVRPAWLRAGVAYLWRSAFADATEVRLAQPEGTAAPVTLYRGTALTRLAYATP